jgi:hypothetical protein
MSRLMAFVGCVTLLALTGAAWGQQASVPADLARLPHLGGATPASGDSFRFVVMGDRTGGHEERVWEQAVAEVNALAPDFVMCVGDLIEGYTEDPAQLSAMWDEFASITGKLNAPFLFCPGNHDVTNDLQLREYIARWGKDGRSYYSFDYRGCHFVVLDSVSADRLPEFAQAQFDWLAADLAGAKAAKHTFVFYHYPNWTGPTVFWKRLTSLLDPARSTVFNGHWHSHVSTQPDGVATYVVAGTAAFLPDRGADVGELRMVVQVTVNDGQPTLAIVPVGQVRQGNYLPQDLAKQRSSVPGGIWMAVKTSAGGQELTIRQTNPLAVPIRAHVACSDGQRELSATDLLAGPSQIGRAVLPLPQGEIVRDGERTYLLNAGAKTPFAIKAHYSWTESTGQPVAVTQTLQVPAMAAPAPRVQAVVADGDLRDWTDSGAELMKSRGDFASEDLSCRMRVAHDQEYVHLAFEIRDQDIYTDDPKISMNDSLELYWYVGEPDPAAGASVPAIGRIILAAPREGQPPIEPTWKLEPTQTPPQMRSACRRTSDGWVCEMSLRAADIGLQAPLSGQIVSWRLIVNDVDKAGGVAGDRKRLRAGGAEYASYLMTALE